jgi:hypothetical protein
MRSCPFFDRFVTVNLYWLAGNKDEAGFLERFSMHGGLNSFCDHNSFVFFSGCIYRLEAFIIVYSDSSFSGKFGNCPKQEKGGDETLWTGSVIDGIRVLRKTTT